MTEFLHFPNEFPIFVDSNSNRTRFLFVQYVTFAVNPFFFISGLLFRSVHVEFINFLSRTLWSFEKLSFYMYVCIRKKKLLWVAGQHFVTRLWSFIIIIIILLTSVSFTSKTILCRTHSSDVDKKSTILIYMYIIYWFSFNK